MVTSVNFNPGTISFIVKNISNLQLHVFNSKIQPGLTLDLMKIPGVSEEDIKVSLNKGELYYKFKANQLSIINNEISFTTSDSAFQLFLNSIGIGYNDGTKLGLLTSQLDAQGRPTSLSDGTMSDLFASSANVLACSVTPRALPLCKYSYDTSQISPVSPITSLSDNSGLGYTLSNGAGHSIDRTAFPSKCASLRMVTAGHLYWNVPGTTTPTDSTNFGLVLSAYPTDIGGAGLGRSLLQVGSMSNNRGWMFGIFGGKWAIAAPSALGNSFAASSLCTFGTAVANTPVVIELIRSAGVFTSARINGVSQTITNASLALTDPIAAFDALVVIGAPDGGGGSGFIGATLEGALFSGPPTLAQTGLLARGMARRGGFDLP